MSKKFPTEFPILATLLRNLEKTGGLMQSGEVNLRKSLEVIVPYQGERTNWFNSVGHRVGLPATRVKSLFYNRQCRIWGDELARIHTALSKATQAQNIEMVHALNANAEMRDRQALHDLLKKEIKSEVLEDIRTLLLELRGSGGGVPVRSAGENLHCY